MVSHSITNTHVPEINDTIQKLHKFGVITAPPAPPYQGYLGSTTNAIMLLLSVCSNFAGGQAQLTQPLTDDQWMALMVIVHRTFYNTLPTAIEGMCSGFCGQVGGSAPLHFMDYVNEALKKSALSDERKKYWRKYFEGIRILRNKASHFNASFTADEKLRLSDAGLSNYIDPKGELSTNCKNYISLAEKALSFIKELEDSIA